MAEGKKPTLQDLVRLKKYPHYYMNPVSGKIVYRRTVKGEAINIRTGVVGKLNPKTGKVDGIKKAEDVVELELKLRATGQASTQRRRKKNSRAVREIKGVTNPLVMDLFDDCVAQRESREPGTKLTYRTSRRYAFEPFFKDKTLQDITSKDDETRKSVLHPKLTENYRDWYLGKYPKRQFMTKHFVMFTNFLFREGYVSKKPDLTLIKEINPTIRAKNKVEPPGRVATESEQEALLAASQKMLEDAYVRPNGQERYVIAVRNRLLLLLGLRYGLRKMEAGKLLREKVDLKAGVMKVWSQKNKEWREIPLVPDVIEAFKMQFNISGESEWVFPMPSNLKRHCASQVLDKHWVTLKKVAGIKGRLRFHDLRHTFATRTADENWPPILACELLDMSMDVYQNTYCKGSLAKKAQLLKATFDQSIGRGG